MWADVVIDPVRNSADEVIGFAKVTRDITQRASGVLTKENEAAKLIVDNVIDYALYLLDLDGTVTSWNPGAQRITGYRAQEIIGSNFSIFFTADDVSTGEPVRSLEIARTTGRFEGTGWRVRRDGKRFWINVVIDAVRDRAGTVIGFANITRDLTQSVALRAVTEENGSIAQTLVDSVVDYAIYLLDLDGRVKSWNAGAHRITGYSADEIIGRNFNACFTDDDVRAGEPVRALAIARATGKYEAEGWRVRKDRTRFWASVVINAVYDPAGEVVGFAKVTRDITQSPAVQYLTEQLRTEREQLLVTKQIANEATARVTKSAERDRATAAKPLDQNRLMTMAEEVKVGYWHFDRRTQEVQWSDEVYRIHGLHRAYRPTLESALASYHDDDRRSVAEMIDRAISDGTPYGFEARIVRPDGAVRAVVANGQVVRDDDGTISGLFGAIQDITERRDAELEREQRIERLGIATHAAQVGIWDWNMVTNAVVWDPMMFALFGFADGQFTPTYDKWLALLYPDDRARAEREVWQAAATGGSFETDFRIVWPSGDIHHIQSMATFVCDAAGSAQRMIGTNWDVTKVRELNAQLRQEKEAQERLTARVNLATAVAQVGIWEWNVRTRAVDWDPVMFGLFGLDRAHGPATYERWAACLHDDDRARAEQELAQAVSSGAPFDSDYRVLWPSGEMRHIRAKAAVVLGADGLAERVTGANWDITEARTLADQLRQEKDLAADAAAHDALTGLFNRRGIQMWIESRPEPCATLLYLDVDGFKAVNDRGGHAVGDETLRVIARLIKDAVRGIDACARVGGDEFVVVLLGEIRPEETRAIVGRISTGVDALRPLGPSDDTRIGMSIGIGHVTGSASSEDALREADTDLYRRKSERQSAELMRQGAEALGREDELRRSESFLARTEAVAGVGGWERDLLTGDVRWSDQTRRIAGVGPKYQPNLEEAIGFYAPEAQPIIKDAIRRAIEFNEHWDLELPFIRKDGRRIWVRTVGKPELIEGKPFALIGALQDITERVASRPVLQAANERLAQATDKRRHRNL